MSEVNREVVTKTCMADRGRHGFQASLVGPLIFTVYFDVLISEGMLHLLRGTLRSGL